MNSVVIIENDPASARIYQARLQADGYHVEIAPTAETGVALLESIRPAAVVMRMSTAGNVQPGLIRQLRTLPAGHHVPILVILNTFFPQLVEEVSSAGATRCLRKIDCTPRLLSDAIHQLLVEDPAPHPHSPPTAQETDSALVPPLISPHKADLGAADEELAMLRRVFIADAEAGLATIRTRFRESVQQRASSAKTVKLDELAALIQTLAATAGVIGHHSFSRLAAALEAFTHELARHPDEADDSRFRSVAQAIDALDHICRAPLKSGEKPLHSPSALALATDSAELGLLEFATAPSGFLVIKCRTLDVAVHLLEENRFELLLIDAPSTETELAEDCARIRASAGGRSAPMLLLTASRHSPTPGRVPNSALEDTLAKPYLSSELVVRMLVLHHHAHQPPPNHPSPRTTG